MQSQESKPGPQRRVEVNRGDHRAPARTDSNLFSFTQVVERSVFGRKIESFFAPQGRRIVRGLDARVVGIKAAAGGEPNRVLRVQRVHWRLKFHDTKRGKGTQNRPLPEAAVEKQLARMRFVVAGPLDSIQRLKTLVTHARMHGA